MFKLISKFRIWSIFIFGGVVLLVLAAAPRVAAGEADILLPDLTQVQFRILGAPVSGLGLMYGGILRAP